VLLSMEEANEDNDHMIDPEVAIQMAMARQ
jgi:hypothetical protein